MAAPVAWLDRPDGHRISYLKREGDGDGVMWLGGFRSDMTGIKASALDAWAAASGRAFVRFDYFAHGQSSGEWREGTLSRWSADALAVLDELTEGPQILVGSSMGAWSSLLAALKRPERVKALVLIAPAPDFTERLMWDGFPLHVRQEIENHGEWAQPSQYGEPLVLTRTLFEDGRRNLVMNGPIRFDGPVRILQGWRDPDVPWSHAVELIDLITSTDIELHLTKSGDHRLSEPDDLARLTATLDAL
ncbi:MAG: alpha/beta hydrolase [Pseudomonadota bacterium]